jgi:hypothetical protein
VVRIWEHQVERDLPACIARIEEFLPRKARRRTKNSGVTKRPGQ